MAYPKFHGITLASGAVIENMHVERLASDPVPVAAGRIWFNVTQKLLKFSTLDAGGAVVIQAIASGDNITNLTSTVSALDARVTTVEGSYIKKDGSVAFTGDVNAGGNLVSNVASPVSGTDAANKDYVTSAIAVLGAAFEYVGMVAGGADAGSALDLSLQTQTGAGDYYKVSTAGYFKVGAAGTPFYANATDGLLFNTSGAVDKIDNTNSNVQGTTSFIAVTGNADTGFTVDVDATFKGRVDTLETDLAAEVARATAAEGALDTRVTTNESDIAALQTAGSGTGSALADEIARAQAAEAVNAAAIAAEAVTARAAELANANAVAAEAVTARAAELANANAITAEAATARAAEGANATDIATNAAAIAALDTSAAAAVAAEQARAEAAEAVNAAAIAAEAVTARAAEVAAEASAAAVAADLVTEAAAARAAELANANAIAAEAVTARAAEVANANGLAAEIVRATAAEVAVDTKVGPLASLTTTDKSSIVAAINDLQVLAGGGTDALKTSINAQRYTASSAAALTHVITHNLNTAFPNVDIRVQGDDLVYRNDIVAFEETSANAITIYMTEARALKVSVMAMDDVA